MKTSDCLKLSLTPVRVGDRLSDGFVIYPGEPSEVVLQIKNLRQTEPLQIQISIAGNFPPSWCQLGTEGQAIPAAAQMDAVLYFSIPDSFFEGQQALRPGEQLQLQYHLLITVTQLEPASAVEQIELNFYVRPRSLYLNFLPHLYREADLAESSAQNSAEVDLTGRFLKIFEQAFEPAVQSLDAMWANLDPLTAPEAMLPFLAHWVGWTMEAGWAITGQRRLIRQAIELHCWRGTRRGLRLYLHAYTGLPLDDSPSDERKHISITEPFGAGFILGNATLGGAVLGSGKPHHFNVHLRANASHPANRLNPSILHQIINQAKPAFCTYDLTVEQLAHES